MRMLLKYRSGKIVEGLLLAVTRKQMRVIVSGKNDTIELSHEDGGWRAEDGETVEIEALTAVNGIDGAETFAGFAPRSMGAGGGSAF